jgi:molybdopterin-guanine dinucleotide biosynthesis protein B
MTRLSIQSTIPLLGFAAASGTGKTTLITAILPQLKTAGVRVGLIKHSHHDFEIDKEGKDSYRLRHAGASPVVIVSKYRRAMIEEFSDHVEVSLADQLALFPPQAVDLILVEGFRHEHFPKIVLHRAQLNNPCLFRDDPSIIAVATDECLAEVPLPQLDLNQPAEITAFILKYFFKACRTL